MLSQPGEKDSIILTQKEQQRSKVIEAVQAGRWSVEAAAEILGLSVRQVWRLKAAYEERGPAGLGHGNRGKPSPGRIEGEMRRQVVALMRGAYAGCNDRHLAELLALRDGVVLGRSSIARIRREEGLKPASRRRQPRHRSRRERRPQEGILLQLDGSYHHWFGPDCDRTTLLGAIDDATGDVVAARFREHEDAQGYFLLLGEVLTQHGIPLELYHDRHSIFQVNPKTPWTPGEELAGKQEPTQFGRALEELGIPI